jgi:peptidoglycan/LPS O-acetylase OafA/YrhL
VKTIPSLNGLRAISILMVVLMHTLQRINTVTPVNRLWFVLGNGSTGVFIFFVISGYLITTLLLREHKESGTISLKDFYIRRAFRILPPAYVNILFVVILGWWGKLQLTAVDVATALFFCRNYLPSKVGWALEHYWTLSIEEQFYLLWPIILLWCLCRRGRSSAIKVGFAVAILCPVIRVLSYKFGGDYLRETVERSFQCRADALIYGCLTALLAGSPEYEKIYNYVARIWWILPIIAIGISGYLEIFYGSIWTLPFGYSLNGICISFFILWCVRNSTSFVGKVLNHKLVMHIGILSYSIYIWQQLFLNPRNASVFGSAHILRYLPVCCLAILAAAETSYYLIERPSLRLRNRVESRLGLGPKAVKFRALGVESKS